MQVLDALGQALLLAVGMAWQVGWSLILGFAMSGAVQALVSKERMQQLLGRDGNPGDRRSQRDSGPRARRARTPRPR